MLHVKRLQNCQEILCPGQERWETFQIFGANLVVQGRRSAKLETGELEITGKASGNVERAEAAWPTEMNNKDGISVSRPDGG